MDPSAFSWAISNVTGNNPRPPEPRPNPVLPSIPCAKMPLKNEVPQEMKKLQELHDVVQSANVKLMRQIVDLQDQLKMKNDECVIMLSDEVLFSEAQQRPFFDEWFKKMLGNNRELDDLRSIEKEVVKFRETIQKQLDGWKREYSIHISLEQEFIRLDKPKPTSVAEVLSMMNAEMERELLNIFRQVEENFKNLSFRLAEKVEELELALSRMDEQTGLIKKLCLSLDFSKTEFEKHIVVEKAYQELQQSEKIVKQELATIKTEFLHSKKELEDKTAELAKIKEDSIKTEFELENVQADKYELQLRCKKAEDKVQELGEADKERKYMSDCLDKSQKSLADARSQIRVEALKRTKVIDEAEETTNSFFESSLLDSSRLKMERVLRNEIAMENEGLRLRCASLEEQLRKESATTEICERNAFMIRFIQGLDIDIQMAFKDLFQKQFGS